MSKNPIINTKLTRTEIIDLVIQETLDKVTERLDEIGKQTKSLKRLGGVDLVQLAQAGRNGWADPSWDNSKVTITFDVSPSQWPVCKELNELKDEQNELHQVQSALHDRRTARLKILKESLEKTEDGQELLGQLKTFSLTVGAKLMLAAAK